jgi:hypothetical protein
MHIPTHLSLLAIAALSACAGQPLHSPYNQAGLPAAVQVPAGHGVAMETSAAGDIGYQCRAHKEIAGRYEWVLLGPDAGLKDRSGKTVGRYYGPPATWEGSEGSRITGAQLAVAPNGEGNIPLQLVKANAGTGSMQGVSYVQRVATRGGVAPAAACGQANEGGKQLVRYSADYIFYKPV